MFLSNIAKYLYDEVCLQLVIKYQEIDIHIQSHIYTIRFVSMCVYEIYSQGFGQLGVIIESGLSKESPSETESRTT